MLHVELELSRKSLLLGCRRLMTVLFPNMLSISACHFLRACLAESIICDHYGHSLPYRNADVSRLPGLLSRLYHYADVRGALSAPFIVASLAPALIAAPTFPVGWTVALSTIFLNWLMMASASFDV